VTPIEKLHFCKEQLQKIPTDSVIPHITTMAEDNNDGNNNNNNNNNDNDNNNNDNDNNERGFLGGVIDYFATPIRNTARIIVKT
jgi:hypothetical protein